jgi:FkbM family methyltransferase
MRQYLRKLRPLMRVYRWYQFQLRNRNIEIDQVLVRKLTYGTSLDVGANIGYYAELLSRRSDRTLAFEPVSATFGDLRYVFGHRRNLRLFNCALGDSDHSAEIRMPRRDGELDAPSASMVVDFDDQEVETISVRQGDALLEQEIGPGRDAVDFIKIDVEGFEYQVLSGLKQTIEGARPVLMVEINCDNTDDPMGPVRLLEDMGYLTFISRVAGDLEHVSLRSAAQIEALQSFDSRAKAGFDYKPGDTTDYVLNFWFVHRDSALREQLERVSSIRLDAIAA